MRSILEQLDNDQAVLLMYLADELPPVDRTRVEQRLMLDEQLRAQLEALRASQENIGRLLEEADASQPVPGSAASSQRMISRLMKQWQADQLLRASRSLADAPVRSKWLWLGPAAAAAVLLVAWGVWWGIQPDKYTALTDASFDVTPVADVAPDDVLADSNLDDLNSSLDDYREDISIVADIDYLNTLSELTTLPQQLP